LGIVQAINFIRDIEVVYMAKVTIVKPTITKEEEIKVFERISCVLEKIVAKEYGVRTKFTIARIQ